MSNININGAEVAFSNKVNTVTASAGSVKVSPPRQHRPPGNTHQDDIRQARESKE